jgi:hypothetical protein
VDDRGGDKRQRVQKWDKINRLLARRITQPPSKR